MNTKNNKTLEEALKNLPQGFKSKLIKEYTDFKRNCSEARFESAGLSAGKFCEIILRLLQEKSLVNLHRSESRLEHLLMNVVK